MSTTDARDPARDLGGYVVLDEGPVPHLDGRYLLLRHRATGARHLHVACDDDHNAFALGFPTPAEDDTGAPHVLEHVLLSGSRRYRDRQGLLGMRARSLATYLNAHTRADETAYPFATRNPADFRNLLGVVLDACFHPLIQDEAVLREACRLEFDDPADPATPLARRGVVHSEMLGMLAAPAHALWRAVRRALLPGTPYALEFLGDPDAMPALTPGALRGFHARRYHPANAFSYTYGNLPLTDTLRQIEDLALGQPWPSGRPTAWPELPRLTAPVSLEASHPGEGEGQAVVAWLLGTRPDGRDRLPLRLLHRALYGDDAAPLRRALLGSGLGSALADWPELSDYSRVTVLQAGLKGVERGDGPRVEALVLETLRGVAEGGLDPEAAERAMRALELEAREVSDAGWPYGLKLYYDLQPAHHAGADLGPFLDPAPELDRLRDGLAGGGLLEGLVRDRLLANPHRALVSLRPDPGLAGRKAAARRAELDAVRAAMSPADEAAVVAQAARLEAWRAADPGGEPLPSLRREAVSPAPREAEVKVHTVGGAALGLCPARTGGLAYLEARLDLSGLPARLVELASLYARLVADAAGRGGAGFGLEASVGTRHDPEDPGRLRAWLAVTARGLARDRAELAAAFGRALAPPPRRAAGAAEALGAHAAALDAGVPRRGTALALRLAASRLSPAWALRERLEGSAQVALVRRLRASGADGLGALIADLLLRNSGLIGHHILAGSSPARPPVSP